MTNIYFWWYFLLIAGIAFIVKYLLEIYSHLNEFPTTPFVPILGHVFDYVNPNTTLPTLTKNLQKHGGVIRQFIGPRKPSLVVANKNFLKFLCDNKKFVGKSQFYRYLKPWLGEGLITSDGPKWLSRRKALTASFTQSEVLTAFVEVFEERSERLLAVLSSHDEEKVDLHPIMKRFTLDVICKTAMGISLCFQKEDSYARSIEILCEVIQNRMTNFFKHFDFIFRLTKDYNREKEALTVVDKMFDTIIEQKVLQENFETPRRDMLDLMMGVSINGRKFSRSDLREEINTFMFAGYDTTSTAMSLTLYEIAGHPQVQAKLYEEQKSIYEDNLDKASTTKEDLEQMHYLHSVILETLRLHTIVPCVGKRVTKNLWFEEKPIPDQLNISVLIYGFHHNPDSFPEPEKFKPERFACEEGIDEYAFIPFGVKPRQCLGKNFALLEMKCLISKLIRNYEIEQVPEKPLKMEPKLVLFSSSGIWVRLKKRRDDTSV